MSLQWIAESPAYWDARKAEVVGGAAEGIFEPATHGAGDVIAGEWWRVEDQGRVVGYGWMDCNWGDAEILLAVDPAARKQGVGTFILDQLEREAAARGLNYLYNIVRPTHPHRAGITKWLEQRRFARAHDDESLKRRVKPAG